MFYSAGAESENVQDFKCPFIMDKFFANFCAHLHQEIMEYLCATKSIVILYEPIKAEIWVQNCRTCYCENMSLTQESLE